MRDESWRTLFHPFEAGHLPMPGSGSRILFLNARPGFVLPEGFLGELWLVQPFRPDFLALRDAGFDVTPEAGGEDYDLALVLAGRHRGRNEALVAEAARRLRPAGMLVAAGAKLEGGDSLRRRIAGLVPLHGHLSKHHGAVFWFERPSDLASLASLVEEPALVEGRFRTSSGMFSHGRADPASALLLANLPRKLGNAVADLGAGWGYLAGGILARGDRPAILHLYEADHASCTAARDNLEDLKGDTDLRVEWIDVTSERLVASYDTIVMNPPFHAAGRGADPGIGEAFVKAAATGLRRDGRLYMVANSGLPYEAALARSFARSGETCREGGFKVLWGDQPRRR